MCWLLMASLTVSFFISACVLYKDMYMSNELYCIDVVTTHINVYDALLRPLNHESESMWLDVIMVSPPTNSYSSQWLFSSKNLDLPLSLMSTLEHIIIPLCKVKSPC